MNEVRLRELAGRFAEALAASDELARHAADHRRRARRASEALTPARIPELSADELRELFFDSDAFRFWRNKEWEFNHRLQAVGLDGLRRALLELVMAAQLALTHDDLRKVWEMRGLGRLLATELLAYRFPDRYWTYSPNVTLPALQALGDDVKDTMPRGQRSDPHLYLALAPRMLRVREALAAAGVAPADNLTADTFLRWVKQSTARPPPRPRLARPRPARPPAAPVATAPAAAAASPDAAAPRSLDLGPLLARAMASQSLHFTEWQLATFYSALQVKGFAILSGISGTGKTRLAQRFAEVLPQPPPPSRNWLFVPVRPDWRDGKALLGYFNPLTRTYEWTPFLRFLLRAAQSYRTDGALAWFVILDEMNLAHVEHYFADLLSVLESGRDEHGWTREALSFAYPEDAEGDVPPRELRLPPSLYFVGTVNVDETTHAFSPKVLDRAFTLELTEADFSSYPPEDGEVAEGIDAQERAALLAAFTQEGRFSRVDKRAVAEHVARHPEVRARIARLAELLRPYELHFGYRVFDEIVAFLAAAERNGLFARPELGDPLDAAVLMKVLPKFHGSRGRLEAPLRAVLAWCLDPDAPAEQAISDALAEVESGDEAAEVLAALGFRHARTAERARRMLRALYTDGFAAFG